MAIKVDNINKVDPTTTSTDTSSEPSFGGEFREFTPTTVQESPVDLSNTSFRPAFDIRQPPPQDFDAELRKAFQSPVGLGATKSYFTSQRTAIRQLNQLVADFEKKGGVATLPEEIQELLKA